MIRIKHYVHIVASNACQWMPHASRFDEKEAIDWRSDGPVPRHAYGTCPKFRCRDANWAAQNWISKRHHRHLSPAFARNCFASHPIFQEGTWPHGTLPHCFVQWYPRHVFWTGRLDQLHHNAVSSSIWLRSSDVSNTKLFRSLVSWWVCNQKTSQQFEVIPFSD